MSFALIENNVVKKFPYSVSELRRDNPGTSFPENVNENILKSWNVYSVVVPPQPTYDNLNENISASEPIYNENNKRWEIEWVISSATSEEIQKRKYDLVSSYVDKTQDRLDEFARTRNYDGILSACTYATSPTLKFSTEGQYCVEVRDATWGMLYVILAEVEAGTRPIPNNWTEIETLLPQLTWPN